METQSMFKTIVFSLGFWIVVFVGVVLTFVELINGHIGGLKEFFTSLSFDLIYALLYVILRLIPSVDKRVFFFKSL